MINYRTSSHFNSLERIPTDQTIECHTSIFLRYQTKTNWIEVGAKTKQIIQFSNYSNVMFIFMFLQYSMSS